MAVYYDGHRKLIQKIKIVILESPCISSSTLTTLFAGMHWIMSHQQKCRLFETSWGKSVYEEDNHGASFGPPTATVSPSAYPKVAREPGSWCSKQHAVIMLFKWKVIRMF